jgi:hypothetical protein
MHWDGKFINPGLKNIHTPKAQSPTPKTKSISFRLKASRFEQAKLNSASHISKNILTSQFFRK